MTLEDILEEIVGELAAWYREVYMMFTATDAPARDAGGNNKLTVDT